MSQTEKTPWHVVAGRVCFTVALVGTVVFIFGNSMQISQVSGAHSRQVMELVNRLFGVVGIGPFSEHFIRKLAHFTEFCMMGFWFMLCLRVYTRHFIKHVSWPLFLGLLTAVLDETIQLYVPGRSSSVSDVLLDFSGVVCGLFVALLLLMFARMCAILYRHRNEV